MERPDIADRDRLAEALIRRHFSVGGSLRLHCHALGWDLLRAPANVVIAPAFLVSRMIALAASAAGRRGLATWLMDKPVLLHTRVAERVETLVLDELLCPAGHSGPQSWQPTSVQREIVRSYCGTRSAIAEITTALLILMAGIVLLRSATPGIVSLAPALSNLIAVDQAIADFPLGRTLGGLWYEVFPLEAPAWLIVSVGAALAAAASLLTAFAGVIADPLQAYSGIHRRRLIRLLRTCDRHENSSGRGVAPIEHVLARTADIADASLGIFRVLRP